MKEELKRRQGIKADAKVILFSGKLMERKRPLDLLKAYERLGCENKSLVFVGEGELRGSIESYSRGRRLEGVHITGFKNQSKMPEYYAIADILVLPSSYETWGVVVNEAMNFQLPIIVSDRVGCGPDLVRHGENGYRYPSGDIGRLAGHLDELLADDGKRSRFGRKSGKIISAYNFGKDAEGILAALENMHRP